MDRTVVLLFDLVEVCNDASVFSIGFLKLQLYVIILSLNKYPTGFFVPWVR